MPRPTRRKRHATTATWAAVAVTLVACGPSDETLAVEGVMDRETFIEVYVELRSEAIRSPSLTISEDARDAVLTRHGVAEEDLLAFVDAYGERLEYMKDLWAEVERRIEALPPVPRDLGNAGA